MPSRTKSELVSEIAALRGRLAELEGSLTDHLFRSTNPPGSELMASEAHYRRLFESAKDGILILDAETGQITDVNPALEEALGYPRGEILGKFVWEIEQFREIVANQSAFRRLQNKEYLRYDDRPFETRRGQTRYVEFISNAYMVNETKVIQCSFRDVTARKHAEDGLRKMNEDLSALVAELQRRDREMQMLNRLNDLLQSCTTQEEAYQVISVSAGDLFPGQNGCLATYHAEEQYLEVVARWGTESPAESTFALADCWAIRRGLPHEVVDPQSSLICRHFSTPPQEGYMCVPLTVHGETLGLLSVTGAGALIGEHQVSHRQLSVTVGEAIKLSLSNLRLREELREQATHDPLTGLFNRRYLEDNLSRELHRALRRNAPLCVVMLDLDHFKEFNDRYGHEGGDVLLRELGQLLLRSIRGSDISCRYGGDEFVLVLPDSTPEDTRQRVEQLRVLAKKLQPRFADVLLGSLALTAGIAAAPEHGSTARDLLSAADAALYRAKQAGHDRIVLYSPTD